MEEEKRRIVIDILIKNESNLIIIIKLSITESDITQDDDVLSIENDSVSKGNTETRGTSITES